MSDAIILFSHGSLLCGAGENLQHLAQAMRSRGDAKIVEVGYLNYSEPGFLQTFERCIGLGAKKIVVAPYFLVSGYFVKVDLPRVLAQATAKFPDIEVRVAAAMNAHPSLAQIVENCAARALPPDKWRDILNTAPQFCKSNPQCPLFGTPKCPATRDV